MKKLGEKQCVRWPIGKKEVGSVTWEFAGILILHIHLY